MWHQLRTMEPDGISVNEDIWAQFEEKLPVHNKKALGRMNTSVKTKCPLAKLTLNLLDLPFIWLHNKHSSSSSSSRQVSCCSTTGLVYISEGRHHKGWGHFTNGSKDLFRGYGTVTWWQSACTCGMFPWAVSGAFQPCLCYVALVPACVQHSAAGKLRRMHSFTKKW